MPAGNVSVMLAWFATSGPLPIHDAPAMNVTVPDTAGPDNVAVSVTGVCVALVGFDVVSAIAGAAGNLTIVAAGPNVLVVWNAPCVVWKLLAESESPVT